MSVAANIKTSRVANLRILVEQVIRRLKSSELLRTQFLLPSFLPLIRFRSFVLLCPTSKNPYTEISLSACDIFMFVSIQAKVLNIASKIPILQIIEYVLSRVGLYG